MLTKLLNEHSRDTFLPDFIYIFKQERKGDRRRMKMHIMSLPFRNLMKFPSKTLAKLSANKFSPKAFQRFARNEKFNSMCKYVSTIIVTVERFTTPSTQSENLQILLFPHLFDCMLRDKSKLSQNVA